MIAKKMLSLHNALDLLILEFESDTIDLTKLINKVKKRMHQTFFKAAVSFLIVHKFLPLTRLEKIRVKT